MLTTTFRSALFSLVSVASLTHIHADDRCAAAQRTLEFAIKEHPENAVSGLTAAIKSNQSCAGPLVESAVRASEASDELVAKLVAAAVRAAPDRAVVIAESAIAVAPSASDEVAQVVQTVLGDCSSIAEDVANSIGRDKGRLLVVLEDALRSHGNCTCEIVGAAVKAAGGSSTVISQVVETAIILKPTLAAEISECASAAAPRQIAAVQKGLDRALADANRGQGALPAAVEVGEEGVNEISETPVPSPEVSDRAAAASAEELFAYESPESQPTESSGYGKNAGYGKNYGKNYGKTTPYETQEEPEDDWGWDWIHWGGHGFGAGGVYMITPSGGLVPPGELVPLSPSSPIPTPGGEYGVPES